MILRTLKTLKKKATIKKNFCVYKNLQQRIAKEINLSPSKAENIRAQFSQLRELQRKFFYNVTEESTVTFFRVSSIFLKNLEIERNEDAQRSPRAPKIHQPHEIYVIS